MNLCRLCVNNCEEFISLYCKNGYRSEPCEITLKYFDIPCLKRGSHLTVICLKCWYHVLEFHNFRQSVLLAQKKLLEDQQKAECIAEPAVDRWDYGTTDIRHDDIAVNVKDEFDSPPVEAETTSTVVDYPLNEPCDNNADGEIVYGYIVKEEEEYVSPPEIKPLDYPTVSADFKDPAAVNNNIFVTDEEELISLVNTTHKISFAKCVNKSEPIMASLEKKPAINTALVEYVLTDDGDTSSFQEDGNVSSNDETYIQSEDDEDLVRSFAGEVFTGDDELMDISETELESFDVFYSSDEDDVYSSNFSLKHRVTKTRPNLNKCTVELKPKVIKGKLKKQNSLVVAGTPQKDKQTSNLSVRQSIKMEKQGPSEAGCSHNDEQTKQMPKKQGIKREQRILGEPSLGDAAIHSQEAEPVKKMPKCRPIKSKREEELDDIIAQWRPNLECTICHDSYTTYTLLREHYREKHPHAEFYILCCDIKIKKRGHLAEHVRLHIDPKAFKCTFCDKSCTRKRNLRLHMLKKHGISNSGDMSYQDTVSSPKKPNVTRKKLKDSDEFIAQWLPILECVVCKMSCSSFTTLQEHFRQQHPDKDCYILCCECKLFQRVHIAEHLRQHTHPRAFKCELCNKCFTMKRTLDYHTRLEHSANIFDKGKESKDPLPRKVAVQKSDDLIAQWLTTLDCGQCSESYPSFTLLQKHFRQKHPNGAGYVLCCQRKFCHRDKLQEHIRVHLHPKGFKCELCGKRYSRETGLQSHVSKQHYISIDGGPSSCQDNNKVSSIEGLDQYHPRPDFMDQSIKRKTIRELDDIIAQWRPNLECAVCNETCSTFTLLQNHFRQYHPNVECYISCCQCKFPGRYDIEEHIRFHKDPNAFKCDICGRCFSRRRALNGHLRTHRPQQQSWTK